MEQLQLRRQLAAEFGASPDRLAKLKAMAYPQATKELAELQQEAKAAYKKLAFKYHPDRNPDDPETAAEKFKLLPGVLKEIQGWRIRPVQRRPRVIRRHFVFIPGAPIPTNTGNVSTSTGGFGHVVSATNNGGTSSTTTYDARRVTWIRFG